MSQPLRLEMLGGLRVLREGRAIALPPSRKTRGLLAYLALTGRPHRRERLCEIFWDRPDDPRGGLRWALSKIRPLVNEFSRERVEADRERVLLALDPGEVDLLDIRRRLQPGATDLSPDQLKTFAAALALPLLDGLDLPNSGAYRMWLEAEREETAQLRRIVLERIIRHSTTSDAEALRWVRDWHTSDPLSPQAAGILARTLKKLGRGDEAVAVARDFARLARDAGLHAVPDLLAPEARPDPSGARHLLRHQTIGFCQSPDGVRIAYATVGSGPPLLKAANWLNHLELDWESLIWGQTFQRLARDRTFIRYDERGNGLSDWDVPEISFECFVRDLEAVVDALHLGRFP